MLQLKEVQVPINFGSSCHLLYPTISLMQHGDWALIKAIIIIIIIIITIIFIKNKVLHREKRGKNLLKKIRESFIGKVMIEGRL